ncbi:MAG TPA: hypothetical protein VFV34_14890 [Blastocatellia bacterium]|nr:hypothetical protein [Blastocatellia bacterium]
MKGYQSVMLVCILFLGMMLVEQPIRAQSCSGRIASGSPIVTTTAVCPGIAGLGKRDDWYVNWVGATSAELYTNYGYGGCGGSLRCWPEHHYPWFDTDGVGTGFFNQEIGKGIFAM